MPFYSKPYLSISEQLDLIQSRGMAITDRTRAQEDLGRIGYYRLSGYSFPFRKSAFVNGEVVIEDDFKEGSSFDEVISLYIFDKKLRLKILDVIERIEIALRVQITLTLGRKGSLAHREGQHLHGNFVRLNRSGDSEHGEWLERHDKEWQRSKEEFAKHFKTKYDGHPPIWVAAEVWDFGTMSMLFQGLQVEDKQEISRYFRIKWEVLQSWLRAINVARNVCAHHSRFWNRAMSVTPRWPSRHEVPEVAELSSDPVNQARLYGIAVMCAYLLKGINPKSDWPREFKAFMQTFPTSPLVSLRSGGFIPSWENSLLWL